MSVLLRPGLGNYPVGAMEITEIDAQELTPEQAAAQLDARARHYLGISGEEFRRRWQAGAFPDADDPKVTRVAMLLPPGA
jgi:hypothetical protein